MRVALLMLCLLLLTPIGFSSETLTPLHSWINRGGGQLIPLTDNRIYSADRPPAWSVDDLWYQLGQPEHRAVLLGIGQPLLELEAPATCSNTIFVASPSRQQVTALSQARLLKSYAIQDFELFILQRIQRQILTASKSNSRNKFKNKQEVAIRLNGTSDLPFLEMMDQYGLLDAIPSNVRFYDYTKFPDKAGVRKINKFDYVVTYSRCEDYFDPRIGKFVDNMYNALNNLDKGNMVAVVFAGNKLPKYWFGYPVVDGDERDDLMLDLNPSRGNGIVIGLRAKPPRNRKDFEKWVMESKNFVVEIDDFNDCRSTGLITIGQPK